LTASLLSERRAATASPTGRPAVVEHVDSPQSASDGRTANLVASLVAFAEPRRTALRQIVSFGAIGVASTLAWAAIYLVLRSDLSASVANAIALVVTAIGNTAANRRWTFGVRGRDGLARDQGAGLIAFVLALALTSGAATALPVLAPHATRAFELAVLTVANAVATAGRFLVLRASIGRRATALG
jgi:putative flippase GtrA